MTKRGRLAEVHGQDELFWCGCKVHLTATCDDSTDGAAGGARTPNLVEDVATTSSTDVTATAGIQQRLAGRGIKSGEHCLELRLSLRRPGRRRRT
ncbi:hypothetical protein OHV05_36050 (plasmid) [Kitasatospora sp. NBC_00070]|uniref:hypothetical protein n=1 Tax=Kitasatospora sp. NBC_00070 TaxID=2975962 RepID=UPI002F91B610